jgi:hypothetical protein
MKETPEYIRIGFYKNFKSYDSILISVDIEGLCELENVFEKLSNGLLSYDFANLKYLDNNFSINIKAYNYAENKGFAKIDKHKYEWRLTSYQWGQFKEKLLMLKNCVDGGHQYLDFEVNHYEVERNHININSLQVIFSLYEYPLSFWEEHFKINNI